MTFIYFCLLLLFVSVFIISLYLCENKKILPECLKNINLSPLLSAFLAVFISVFSVGLSCFGIIFFIIKIISSMVR